MPEWEVLSEYLAKKSDMKIRCGDHYTDSDWRDIWFNELDKFRSMALPVAHRLGIMYCKGKARLILWDGYLDPSWSLQRYRGNDWGRGPDLSNSYDVSIGDFYGVLAEGFYCDNVTWFSGYNKTTGRSIDIENQSELVDRIVAMLESGGTLPLRVNTTRRRWRDFTATLKVFVVTSVTSMLLLIPELFIRLFDGVQIFPHGFVHHLTIASIFPLSLTIVLAVLFYFDWKELHFSRGAFMRFKHFDEYGSKKNDA